MFEERSCRHLKVKVALVEPCGRGRMFDLQLHGLRLMLDQPLDARISKSAIMD